MNRQPKAEELLAFMRAHPLFFLATEEGGRPFVRGIMMHRTDERGILFTTGTNKDMYRQLLANPRVELCYCHEQQQLRVSGRAVLLDEQRLKEEIVEARPFMKPWIEMGGYEVMAVFRVEDCEASFWSMERPLGKSRAVRLFGAG